MSHLPFFSCEVLIHVRASMSVHRGCLSRDNNDKEQHHLESIPCCFQTALPHTIASQISVSSSIYCPDESLFLNVCVPRCFYAFFGASHLFLCLNESGHVKWFWNEQDWMRMPITISLSSRSHRGITPSAICSFCSFSTSHWLTAGHQSILSFSQTMKLKK